MVVKGEGEVLFEDVFYLVGPWNPLKNISILGPYGINYGKYLNIPKAKPVYILYTPIR